MPSHLPFPAPQGFDSFDSIPVAIYWGVITLTTIGYGDIYPRTSIGQAVCCFVGFYAVCIGSIPVGIIGAGYVEELQAEIAAKEEERRRSQAAEEAASIASMHVTVAEISVSASRRRCDLPYLGVTFGP